MRHRKRLARAAVMMVMITAPAAIITLRSQDPSTVAKDAAQPRWRALPPLPDSDRIDVDGASLITVGRQLFVTATDRGSSATDLSDLHAYRLANSRWRPAATRPLPVNANSPVTTIAAGGRLCAVATSGNAVNVSCLARGRWQRLGPPVFAATIPEPDIGTAGAFVSNGRIYVLRVEQRNPRRSATGGKLEHRVFRFTGEVWTEPAPGPIDPTSPRGIQRPFGFTHRDRPCVAYDRREGILRPRNVVAIRCLSQGRWRLAAPDLTAQQADAQLPGLATRNPSQPAGVNIDGVASLGTRIFIGVDLFYPTTIDWPILQTDTVNQWMPTALGAADPRWDEQGSLHSLQGRIYAVRFDQRGTATGQRTQLVVNTISTSGTVTPVGGALLDNAPLLGPVYWGLAMYNEELHAMATVPRPGTRRNEIRVFRLAPPS